MAYEQFNMLHSELAYLARIASRADCTKPDLYKLINKCNFNRNDNERITRCVQVSERASVGNNLNLLLEAIKDRSTRGKNYSYID